MTAIEWVKDKAKDVGDGQKMFNGNLPFRMVKEIKQYAKNNNAHENMETRYTVFGMNNVTIRIGNMKTNNTHVIACFF